MSIRTGLRIVLVLLLGLLVADCKHSPASAEREQTPVADCLALVESAESLTLESPYVATRPVIKFDDEAVGTMDFQRFGALYAGIPGDRGSNAAVREFERYWYGRKLADEAGVVVTREQVDARMRIIEQRFPDADTFDRFLEDAGASRRKLRVAVCRDLRLTTLLEQKYDVHVSDAEVRAAVDDGIFSHLTDQGVTAEQARVVARRALEASAFIEASREILDRTKIGWRVSQYGRPRLKREFFDEHALVSGVWRAELAVRSGEWRATVVGPPRGLEEMQGLTHDNLVLVPDKQLDLRIAAASIPYVVYLADERVVLSADPRRRYENQVELVRREDVLVLASENQSAAAWLASLGTLSLTYIDALARDGISEPAMQPRGKPLGRKIRFACRPAQPACTSSEFVIDVLEVEEARTWAVYSYPAIEPGTTYARHCAVCHGDRGEGIGETHPPVVGTRWTTGELGDRALIEAVVLGTRADSLRGATTIVEESWGSDLMPAFAEHLEPREVTAAINYVTTELDGRGPRVTEQQVIDAYCEHGYDVVYRARVSPSDVEDRLARARQHGDCGPVVRNEFELLDEPITDEQTLERVDILYGANCASCHGPQGQGDGPLAQAIGARPTDFTEPAAWEHGRHVTGAFASIADGSDDRFSHAWGDKNDFVELAGLAQKVVAWLPDEQRASEPGESAYLDYCRELTERRRLAWDRCADDR